mmetsp:Transcript_41863/g.48538  ORF Transcript_41863/g.48538 Transcript_41863/m.48538 type:complete len:88 (+) Transcript_41863:70-333(+)
MKIKRCVVVPPMWQQQLRNHHNNNHKHQVAKQNSEKNEGMPPHARLPQAPQVLENEIRINSGADKSNRVFEGVSLVLDGCSVCFFSL